MDDMARLFDGIPLDQVTTSMTINAPASILMLLYQIVAESRGGRPRQLRGTIQNDILKEYIARGTYIFPPRPSMRLTTDTFGYCGRAAELEHDLDLRLPHPRGRLDGGPGSRPSPWRTASPMSRRPRAGLEVDAFGPRLSFFFNAHSNFLEEVAKFRAARRCGANHARTLRRPEPTSLTLRFHTQTGGSTFTAQQPDVNVVRVALQGLSAVMGGTQSLHTNAYDEALSLPKRPGATRPPHPTGDRLQRPAADSVDPLAGSYVVEALTDEIERLALELMAEVEGGGGAVAAVKRLHPGRHRRQRLHLGRGSPIRRAPDRRRQLPARR